MIFISYSYQDTEIAFKIAEHFKNNNIAYFLAEEDIHVGTKWVEEIVDNLQESDKLLYLASQNSLRSASVQNEIGMALALGIKIFPYLIDICPEDLPPFIRDIQALQIHLNNFNPNVLDKIMERKSSGFGVVAGILLAGTALLFASSKDQGKEVS